MTDIITINIQRFGEAANCTSETGRYLHIFSEREDRSHGRKTTLKVAYR